MNLERTCPNCKFYNESGCAVNPIFWQAIAILKGLDKEARQRILPVLSDCTEYDESQKITIEISLSERKWKEIGSLNIDRYPAVKEIITIARDKYGLNIEEYDDIPF